MKEQLSHILDQSVCLTRRQIAAYLDGRMEAEEVHAVQLHLASCPLCSLAMDGYEAHTSEGLAALSDLNADFLKEHFDKSLPQIHLNSVAPAAVITEARRKRRAEANVQLPYRSIAAAAAMLLLGAGAWWLMRNAGRDTDRTQQIALAEPIQPGEPLAERQNIYTKPETAGAGDAGANAPVVPAKAGGASAAGKPGAASDAKPASGEAAQADELKEAATAAPVASVEQAAPPPAPAPGVGYQAQEAEPVKTPPEGHAAEKSARAEGLQPAAARTDAEQSAVVNRRKAAAPPAVSVVGDSGDDRDAPAKYRKREPAPSKKNAPSLEAAQKAITAGKREEARRILQAIVQEGGEQKREARRLLRRLNREEDGNN